MKKTFFNIFACIVASIAFCSVFAGCSSEEEEKKEENLATSPKIVLNGFENAKDLNAVNLYNGFGKLERSNDEAYVSEGEYSAKCTVLQSPWDNFDTPYFYQAANIEYKGNDFTDFGNVSMLTIDVTNTDENVAKMGIQIVYSFKANSGTGKYEALGDTVAWFELQSGFNEVNLNVIKDSIPEVEKEDGTVINQVVGLNVFFERPKDGDRVFYVDNICLHMTNDPVEGEPRALAENEVCSFDYIWQYKMLTPNPGAAGADYNPKLTWQNEIVSPKANGGAAVRVDTEGIVWPKTSSNYFTGLIIGSDVLNYVDLSVYEGQDKLCFDIYIPEENGVVMMSFGVWRNNNLFYSKQFCDGNGGTLELKRGWNYFEFTVDELNSGEKVTSNICFATTNKISFTFRTDDTPNGVFYIDNIRMEKAQ